MSGWTKEPWWWGDDDGCDSRTIWGGEDKPIMVPHLKTTQEHMHKVMELKSYSKLDMLTPNEEDGPRIVDCVNGCAGIPNPEGIGELVKAFKAARDWRFDPVDIKKFPYEQMEEALRACGIRDDVHPFDNTGVGGTPDKEK